MQRIDRLLVSQQLAASRTQAQAWLEAGRVEHCQAGQWLRIDKPSVKLPEDTPLRVSPCASDAYVSRGALKLAAAMEAAQLDAQGRSALDVGQSTGGFTDWLLQAGASQVVGLEVGHDQLHPKLRQDPRVHCLEKINARYLQPQQLIEQQLPSLYDLIVMDVSFISQTLILPNLPALLKPQGWLVSLVKPQFEVGKENLGKGGIVKNPALYAKVQQDITESLNQLGLTLTHWLDSPITGGDGNREFLLVAQKKTT